MTFSKFHLQDGQESQRNQSFYGIPGFYRKFWKSSAFYGHGQVSHTRKRGQTITNQSHKMLLETGGQNSHWGYHVPSMMNVLDFEVLNGSPGDKQTNKRLWKEVYQAANGMKSLKEKKQQNWTRGDSDKSQRYGTTLEVTRCVCVHKHEHSCLHDHDLRSIRLSLCHWSFYLHTPHSSTAWHRHSIKLSSINSICKMLISTKFHFDLSSIVLKIKRRLQ